MLKRLNDVSFMINVCQNINLWGNFEPKNMSKGQKFTLTRKKKQDNSRKIKHLTLLFMIVTWHERWHSCKEVLWRSAFIRKLLSPPLLDRENFRFRLLKGDTVENKIIVWQISYLLFLRQALVKGRVGRGWGSLFRQAIF